MWSILYSQTEYCLKTYAKDFSALWAVHCLSPGFSPLCPGKWATLLWAFGSKLLFLLFLCFRSFLLSGGGLVCLSGVLEVGLAEFSQLFVISFRLFVLLQGVGFG